MVCGALWWSPGQTRPLRGQIVQFTFPLWRSGTAVFLASGSRCVTPRPFIGRDPAATHCAHTRLYYLYQKMWAARVSFIHCSAFGRVLRGRLLARVQRGGVSAVGEPAWSASGRVLALSSLGRTDCCTVYAPLGSSMRLGSNIQTNRIRAFNSYGIGSGRVPKRCAHRGSQAENYPITREQIDDILQNLEQGVLGRKTADGSTLPSLDRVLRRASSQAGHVAALRLLDMAALRLLVAVGALATAHGALELTEDNWDSALAGKSAFVKFLAPW